MAPVYRRQRWRGVTRITVPFVPDDLSLRPDSTTTNARRRPLVEAGRFSGVTLQAVYKAAHSFQRLFNGSMGGGVAAADVPAAAVAEGRAGDNCHVLLQQ